MHVRYDPWDIAVQSDEKGIDKLICCQCAAHCSRKGLRQTAWDRISKFRSASSIGTQIMRDGGYYIT